VGGLAGDQAAGGQGPDPRRDQPCSVAGGAPELVAQRIKRFTDLVGVENVIASTACGFAQSFRTTRQHPSIQSAKLEALVEGARIASR
jgi:hypothetical protein